MGTAQLTTRYGATNEAEREPSRAESSALLAAAARLGITTLDTAPAYGDAEATIGTSAEAFVVHTKVEAGHLPSESLRRSQARLGSHVVEVLYFHDPTEVLRPHGPAATDARALLVDRDLRLGASVYERAQFEAAIDDPAIAVVQVPVNLLDRRFAGDALTVAAASGTAVVLRSVLLQGVLAADPAALPPHVAHLSTHVAAVAGIAREHGLSPVELALGWVATLPSVEGVVLGATSPRELTELVAAASTVLSPEAIAAVDAIDLPDSAACDPRRWAA